MKRRSFNQDKSGQVIVITSLLVALILISTVIYVIETEKGVPTIVAGQDNISTEYQQGAKNTLISALSNITRGGSNSILSTDLNELNSVIALHSYQNMVKIDYTLLNVAPYQNGVWISRGTNGVGISSAYASFSLNSSGFSTTSNLEYAANVTSIINLTGKYVQLNENLTQINLAISLFNDGKFALAENFIVSFQNSTGWVIVEDPTINSFSNGTYTISFNVESSQLNIPITVSVDCQDKRGIIVGASVECSS